MTQRSPRNPSPPIRAESEWVAELLAALEHSTPEAAAAARYIHQHLVQLGTALQPTGARWRLGGRIELHPRFLDGPPDATYPLSLIIHEVVHLTHGPFVALSVYGEMEAWQAQFAFMRRVTGRFHELAGKNQVIGELMSLPLGWDREVLAEARKCMRAYAGPRYRIDLLPLYPLALELRWVLTRTKPKVAQRY